MLVLGLWFLGWRDYADVREDLVHNLESHARHVSKHANRTLESVELTLEMLANRYAQRDWTDLTSSSSVQQDLIAASERLPQTTGIWLTDQNGYLRVVSDGPQTDRVDLFDRTYWRIFGITWRDDIYIGAPIQDRLQGRTFFTVSAPIMATPHAFRGVASAALDPGYYKPVMQDDGLDCAACEAALVRADGTVLIATGPMPARPRIQDLLARTDIPNAQRSQGAPRMQTIRAENFVGADDSILSVRASEVFDLYVITTLPADTIFATWIGRSGPIMGIGVLTLGMLLLFAWRTDLAARSLAASNQSLAQRTVELRQRALEARQSAEALDAARQDAEAREQEQRRLREEAAAASRAKSEFLAMMSHELRTPLNAILGFSEVISIQAFGPQATDRYSAYAQDIHDSGQHLLSLINDILDLSKIEAGRYELEIDEVRIDRLVSNAAKLASHRVRDPQVQLEVDASPLLAQVDPRAVKQMLMNLLSNAAKHTECGRIRVCAHAHGRDLLLSVADTGPGMDESEIARALEPFSQIDPQFNRKHEGTGLGLTIVQKLADLHDGSFDLQSEKGRGTIATVRLRGVIDPDACADQTPDRSPAAA